MPDEGPVGRQQELARVHALLDAAQDGLLAVAIVGPAGIGKTTVLREGVRRAEAQGRRVLGAHPTGAEARLSFAALGDLLAGVEPELLDRLPEPQRGALQVALLLTPARRAPEPRLIGTALLSLLEELAAERDVLIAIDDLHWLDAPSSAALEFALRRIGGSRVQAIISTRAEEPDPPVLVALASEGLVERVELGPLSLASLHRVLVEELGRAFPRPTLVRIATAAQGNPLYAIEIARLLDREGDHGGPVELPVPDSLGSLVAARVRSLPASTRDALLRAAALARPDLRLVDADALAPAEEAGLVRIRSNGRVDFVHPLFASAVYASSSTSRRRRAHQALARFVDDPEERARHLALASSGPDERVAEELECAARRARMRGAPDAAAELTELALRLLPEGSRIDELRLRLAEDLFLASDFQRAVHVLEELLDRLPSGDLRARALLALADVVFWRSGESAALALSEEAFSATSEPLVKARCQVAIAMHAGTVDLPKAAAAARAALALLESREDADPALVAAALASRVRADLFLGNGLDDETAERALALEEGAPPAVVDTRMAFKLGQWLRYVDDFDGARERLAQAEQQAREEGDESSLANILLNRVILETWAGRLDEAAGLAEQMVDAFAQRGVEVETHNLWQVLVDAFAGRVDAVRAAATTAAAHDPTIAALWDRAVGLAELAAGDAAAADRRLSRALEQFDRVDFREPAIWRVDGDAIEAALAVGELDRARRLVERFEERAARSRIPWSLAVSARCRGLLHAADGELELAARALERALAAHEDCPMPFEHARTLLVLGQVRRRRKERREARAAFQEALTLFEDLGALPWAKRARADLARIPVRRAPGDLTPTEETIAGLAATGLTNRVIAERIFVSPKTVESNLARVYRKLGIRSRAELGRAMAERQHVIGVPTGERR